MTSVEHPAALAVSRKNRAWTFTFNRPDRRNVIDGELLDALSRALDQAESDAECRAVILQGSGGFFCTGMDFSQVRRAPGEEPDGTADDARYMNLLRRFSSGPKVIISQVEGVVMAGGMGFVAASDLVIGGTCKFSLSEALWGLLPACVAPYLVRRVGFQPAYRMTLTTDWIDCAEAHRIGLVDIRSDQPSEATRRQLLRLSCLTDETILDLKAYFRRMWRIDDETERAAIAEVKRLMNKPHVRENIRRYVETNRFPWERD